MIQRIKLDPDTFQFPLSSYLSHAGSYLEEIIIIKNQIHFCCRFYILIIARLPENHMLYSSTRRSLAIAIAINSEALRCLQTGVWQKPRFWWTNNVSGWLNIIKEFIAEFLHLNHIVFWLSTNNTIWISFLDAFPPATGSPISQFYHKVHLLDVDFSRKYVINPFSFRGQVLKYLIGLVTIKLINYEMITLTKAQFISSNLVWALGLSGFFSGSRWTDFFL